ncbi:DUF397 domain-containing protein [Actinomycetes bacterium KLBMP 9797]
MSESDATPPWRKSSRCDSSACLEIKLADRGRVLIRDSKEDDGAILEFSTAAFRDFLGMIATKRKVD